MSKQELIDALKSEQAMAEYLEVRDDGEIISDIRSVIPPGLTKREYFAAAALPALISTLSETLLGGGLTAEQIEELIAGQAFGVADAMIVASKTGGPEHG